jgi:hypothetical protein
MRKISALLAFAFLAMFAASCAQPTGPAASGNKSFGGESHAKFDIPVPTLGGSSTGSTINLSWSNTHVVISGTDMGEFWGTEQVSMRDGSGHTDVFMWDAVNNEWDELGSTTTGTWQLTNMADGTYTFMVKEKSLEGFTPNQYTHHSENSNSFDVTVASCVNVWSVTSTTNPIQNPGGTVTGNALTQKKANNVNAAKFNLHFWLNASCPNYSTTGHTDITVHVVNPNATTNTVTATEDVLNPGHYLANGIEWNQTGIVGPYTVTILVGGQPVAGSWTFNTTN